LQTWMQQLLLCWIMHHSEKTAAVPSVAAGHVVAFELVLRFINCLALWTYSDAAATFERRFFRQTVPLVRCTSCQGRIKGAIRNSIIHCSHSPLPLFFYCLTDRYSFHKNCWILIVACCSWIFIICMFLSSAASLKLGNFRINSYSFKPLAVSLLTVQLFCLPARFYTFQFNTFRSDTATVWMSETKNIN